MKPKSLNIISKEQIEKAAKALFEGTPHGLLDDQGYSTQWETQPEAAKEIYREEASTVARAFDLLPL